MLLVFVFDMFALNICIFFYLNNVSIMQIFANNFNVKTLVWYTYFVLKIIRVRFL